MSVIRLPVISYKNNFENQVENVGCLLFIILRFRVRSIRHVSGIILMYSNLCFGDSHLYFEFADVQDMWHQIYSSLQCPHAMPIRVRTRLSRLLAYR